MNTQQSSAARVLRMSFLDVVSCALAAAVLLGLVFSIVRQRPPVQTSTPPFISVSFEVGGYDERIVPLIGVHIYPPGRDSFVLEIRDFDARGLPKPVDRRRRPGDPIDNISLVGFSPEGRRPHLSNNARFYQLFVAAPDAGDWRFAPRYTDHYHEVGRPSVPPDFDLRSSNIIVRTTAMTRDRRVRLHVDAAGGENIAFGRQAAVGAAVTIQPYDGSSASPP